jgi:membrane protein YqaA with SNARE-associated domain
MFCIVFALDVSGGMAIVHGMTRNYNLKVVVLSDNKVGDDVITLLAGRLRGNLTQMCESLLTSKFWRMY